MSSVPTLDLILKNFKNFNARSTRDALLAYHRHIANGGKMFWAVAGAMSSAQLGITLAPAIREGLVHGLSVTGANLEESLFRLVAHHGYKDFPDYRYFTKKDDTRILNDRMRRVTDTSIPEDEAFVSARRARLVHVFAGGYLRLSTTYQSEISDRRPDVRWQLALVG